MISPYVYPGLQQPRKSEMDLALNALCNHYRVLIGDVKGRSRQAELVAVRQAFCFTMHKIRGFHLTEIGKCISRDHSTVIHANKAFLNIISDHQERNKYRLFMDKYDAKMLVQFDKLYPAPVRKAISHLRDNALPKNFGRNIFFEDVKKP
jgi:hypothetical protein